MNKTNLQPIAKSQVQTADRKPSRLFFIDHLRSFLMILVVLHHVSLVYGASLQGYYYVEPPYTDPLAFLVLLIFALVNQSWFMGAFFLLAGYFTPASFDRKGPGAYLKDRLLRLGIPLLIFYFVLSPISFIGYYLMPAEMTGISTPLTWQSFWQAYPNFLSIGPLWFVAMLLVFSFGYAAWRWLTRNRSSSSMGKSTLPSYLGIGVFILALAVVSYLTRIIVPLGKSVLQFPTLAYLPQYLSFFVIGTIASRQNWFRTLPNSMGAAGFVTAVVVGVILFPLAFSGQLFSLELSQFDNATGSGHWQSAVYALWDSAFAVGICLGAITLFRRIFNGESSLGRFLSQQSYAVYLIHIPIIVFLAYVLRGLTLASLLKFGVAAVIMVPVCYVVAYAVRKLPLAARIL
jgi:glucan biosynthesis protein C